MRSDSLYRLTAACLITHEIESVFLPMLLRGPFHMSAGSMDHQVFIWAQAPIAFILVLLAEVSHRASLRYGICVFAVAHAGLHWFYSYQMTSDFSSIASWVLILLAGIFGAAYLVPAKAR